MVQVGATECLLAQEDEAETTRILTVLEACNVLDTPKRKGNSTWPLATFPPGEVWTLLTVLPPPRR